MNPNIAKIMKLFAELTDDERLDVIDRIEEEYGIDSYIEFDKPVALAENTQNQIHIRLTRGAIEHIYITLDKRFDFFPGDALGYTNNPPERRIRLTVYGYRDPIETYILQDKNRFHARSFTQFFNEINAKPGKFVVIERKGEYDYHLYPMM